MRREAAALTETIGPFAARKVSRQTLAGGNDWTVMFRENYILILENNDPVFRISRQSRVEPPILSRPDDGAETTVAHACAFADQNATHASEQLACLPVVCARAAIVKSWAHGCIPVPKGAKLSNNALPAM
jgi:hypothetical protein